MSPLEVGPPERLAAPWHPHLMGHRIVPATQVAGLFPGGKLPAEVIAVPAREGPGSVAVCCPITGVPLTQKMARAAGITRGQIAAMVRRDAPLGAQSPESWAELQTELVGRLPSIRGYDAAGQRTRPLGAGRLQVVVAGSAIACFSSIQTTADRGRFPAGEAELERMIRTAPRYQDADPQQLAGIVAAARGRYRALDLGDRVPAAPWFSILSYLGLEDPSDCDVRISSAVVDEVMQARAASDPGIAAWTGADRLNRWNRDHLDQAFPDLKAMRRSLCHHAEVSLGFLSPRSAGLMQTRREWWTISDTAASDR